MGILNITPDSFSDGGQYFRPEDAVRRAREMIGEGAEILDLGAESTRPGGGIYGGGALDVSAQEEIDRLLPVLETLRADTDLPLSVDTRKGEVAEAALAGGADLINDISLLGDPALGRAVARAGCPLVLMHSRGAISTMQKGIRFEDVVGEVRAELQDIARRAAAQGVAPERVIVDPGIGFGKTFTQNVDLIAGLRSLATLGHPILLGTSRKSFIGHLTARPGEDPSPPDQRLAGSLATVGWADALGVEIVRVHDVAETVRFLRVWSAIREALEATGSEHGTIEQLATAGAGGSA